MRSRLILRRTVHLTKGAHYALLRRRLQCTRLCSSDSTTRPKTSARLPLAGVRILEISRVLAAPLSCQILSDLGAEVIKIERPVIGDETRQWGPPFIDGESAYFLSANRNKKSVCVDLKSRRGRQIIEELSKHSDVLVENFLPGKLDSLGLGYSDLTIESLNPHLIYCSLTGYDSDSLWSGLGGYDVAIQSIGGLMSITGSPESGPCKTGVALIDIITGLFLHGAVIAALRTRDRQLLEIYKKDGAGSTLKSSTMKCGEHLTVSLLDAQLSSLVNIASNYLIHRSNGSQESYTPQRWGSAHESIVPYQVFETLDQRYIMLAGTNDGHFRRLCELLSSDSDSDSDSDQQQNIVDQRVSLSDLESNKSSKSPSKAALQVRAMLSDDKFKSNRDRVANRKECIARLQQRVKEKPLCEWLNLLESNHKKTGDTLVFAPMNTVPEILESDYCNQQKTVLEYENPHATIDGSSKERPLSGIKYPVRFRGKNPEHMDVGNVSLVHPPPALGQHTREVLQQICGIDDFALEQLEKDGVIQTLSS